IELAPCPGPELGARPAPPHRPAIGTIGVHRVVCVADRDDARAQRDLLTRESVGVAGAVPALVTCTDQPGGTAERRYGRDDPLAHDRVAPHELLLGRVEGSGLVEDGVGYRDLADVVELG